MKDTFKIDTFQKDALKHPLQLKLLRSRKTELLLVALLLDRKSVV